jgi:hypothetical protein
MIWSSSMTRQRNTSFKLSIEALEARQLLSASPTFGVLDPTLIANLQDVALIGNGGGTTLPGGGGGVVIDFPDEAVDPTNPPEHLRDQDMGLPLLDSKPGAAQTIHLDFTGHNVTVDWDRDGIVDQISMSPFTTDVQATPRNINSFSADEKARIHEIWARVAEDFAPFNINVSTHYYGSFGDRQALKVVIGDYEGGWYPEHRTVYGIATRNSFTRPELPNLAFVFNTNPHRASQTASHEAGHAFGLAHMSPTGSTAEWSPIMGAGLTLTPRITWHKGRMQDTPSKTQDDMAVLARAENVFGYRLDDHGNTAALATTLAAAPPSNTIFDPPSFVAAGVLHQTTDVDFFKFTNDGGAVQVRLDLAQYEPNLVPKIEIWSSTTRLVTIRQSQAKPIVHNLNLGSGTFYVKVMSRGNYGEVGQYQVRATLTDNGPILTQSQFTTAMPAALLASTPTTGSSGLAAMPQVSQRAVARETAAEALFADSSWRPANRSAAALAPLTLLTPSSGSEALEALALPVLA